jgi:hypothetical protein
MRLAPSFAALVTLATSLTLVASVGAAGCSSGGGASGNAQGGASTTAAGSPTGSTSTGSTSTGGSPGVTPVLVIVLENHDWAQIKGSADAPFTNGLLAQGAHAEQAFTPPKNHPSEPNYLWLEAGQSFGITNDDDPAANHQSSTAHLVTELEKAGRSWKSYQEDISGTDCPLVGVKKYATKHNPMVFFDDVTDTNEATSQHCITHVRPYTELAGDLANDTIPDYSFITPNLCNDTHDQCAPQNNQVKQGDDWLAQAVPAIMGSKAYTQRGAVLVVTWDEGDNDSDGPIGLIVLSSSAKAGFASQTHYTHSSTLKTVQEILGVTPLLGGAADPATHDLSDLFTKLPTPN